MLLLQVFGSNAASGGGPDAIVLWQLIGAGVSMIVAPMAYRLKVGGWVGSRAASLAHKSHLNHFWRKPNVSQSGGVPSFNIVAVIVVLPLSRFIAETLGLGCGSNPSKNAGLQ